jgi:hypothetical protein
VTRPPHPFAVVHAAMMEVFEREMDAADRAEDSQALDHRLQRFRRVSVLTAPTSTSS